MAKLFHTPLPLRLLTGCAVALLVAACQRGGTTSAPPLDALPLAATSPPVAPAPAGPALPSAAPARVGVLADPQGAYAFADQADAAGDAYADAPPDYAVDYQGGRPWIWRGEDGSERVVEVTPHGLRDYYYQPGADSPYFVEDDGYGYGFTGGELVEVYGPGGVIEPYGFARRRAALAGRYLAWGAALYAASLHQPHIAAERARWEAHAPLLAARRAAWAQDRSRVPAWADYHAAHAAREDAHWSPERDRRGAEPESAARAREPATPNPPAPPAPPGAEPGRPLAALPLPPPGHARGAAEPSGRRAPEAAPGDAALDRQTAEQALSTQRRQDRVQAEEAQRQAAAQAFAARRTQAQADRTEAQAERGQAQARNVQARNEERASQAAAREQARAQAEAQRDAALQARIQAQAETRAQADAQRQAAEQARATAQAQVRAQAEAQRQAAVQARSQAEAEAQAHRQAAEQARAAQAEAQRQAAAAARAAAPRPQPRPDPHPNERP